MMEKYNCNSCNKEFEDYKTNRMGKNVFCSIKCHNEWQTGKTNHYWLGKKHTKDTKEKMKKAKKNEKERPWRRTGKFINCSRCKKEIYKEKRWFKKNLKPYCSLNCANKTITKAQIESCRKLGLSKKGKINSKEHRKNISTTRKKLIREGKIRMEFPKEDTKIEVKIQNFLKELEIEFFIHNYMKINHGYLCDIFIPSMNLVIECDGNYWHKYPIGNEIDHIRTKEMIEKGFKVLRLWESEIKVMKLNNFKEKIYG